MTDFIGCLYGSIIGTLIGLCGSILYANYMFNSWKSKIYKLIEDANTFKITLKNEVFREG